MVRAQGFRDITTQQRKSSGQEHERSDGDWEYRGLMGVKVWSLPATPITYSLVVLTVILPLK